MHPTLRTRTNIAFALALFSLAAIGWVCFRNVKLLRSNDAWVAHTREVLERSARLDSHLAESVAARRGYVLTSDPQLVQAFSEASRAAITDLEQLRRLTADNPEQQRRVADLRPLIESRLTLLQQSIEAHRADPVDREAQANFTAQGTNLRERISRQIAEFENVENALLQERSASEAASLRLTLQGLSILCLFVFLVIALAVWIVNLELARRTRAEQALARQKNLLQSVLDNMSDAVIVADEKGKIILGNPASTRLHGEAPFGTPPEKWAELFGLYQPDRVTPIPAQNIPMMRAIRGEAIDGEEVFVRNHRQNDGRWQLVSGRPLKDEQGQCHGGVLVIRDIDDRKHAEEERGRLIEELRQALASVKTLSGLLPICASCKKIRDDRGYWNQIESYIRDHSEAQFTHGLCPECLARLYPEISSHGPV
jgi:PAS domain S-box-containing protein